MPDRLLRRSMFCQLSLTDPLFGNGALSIIAKNQASVTIQLVGIQNTKRYQLSASITDANGVLTTETDFKP